MKNYKEWEANIWLAWGKVGEKKKKIQHSYYETFIINLG